MSAMRGPARDPTRATEHGRSGGAPGGRGEGPMRRFLGFGLLVLLVGTTSPARAGSGSHRTPAAVQRSLAHERADLRAVLDRAGRVAPLRSRPLVHNFRVLGHIEFVGDAIHADVAFFDYGGRTGKFAFIGSWVIGCPGTGVKIVDVNDPADPKLISIAGSHRGESHEDMDVVRIGSRVVLVIGVQMCGDGGRTGADLIDITDPAAPSRLAFFPTPGGGAHELDVVKRTDGRVLALLAVPFVEFENTYFGADAGGELRIVDISDPKDPWEVSSWGIIADSSLPIVAGNDEVSNSFQGLGQLPEYFAHSVRAADGGMTAYVSYWDGGVLKLDIGDPAHPELVARTTFPLPADGDAHSMTTLDVRGHRFILQNDEDNDPFTPPVLTSSATGATKFLGTEEWWAPTKLTDSGQISGFVFDAGRGCRAQNFAGAAGKVVLLDSVDPSYVGIIDGWGPVPCEIGHQVVLAAKAGAKAVVSNLVSPGDADAFIFPGDLGEVQDSAKGMPIIQISNIDDEAHAIREALESRPVRVHLTPAAPTHGFVRVFQEDIGRDRDGDGVVELRQVGKFDELPNVAGTIDTPPGVWAVHNTEVRGRRAYSSWYSNGIVALNLDTPAHPRRVGRFAPPDPLVWGVAIDPETGILYVSDMRSGLWIVRPTGKAAS